MLESNQTEGFISYSAINFGINYVCQTNFSKNTEILSYRFI